MFINYSIKILISLLFLFINYSLFAEDLEESDRSLNSEYADKMIKKGFQLVTIGTDQRFMTAAAKAALSTIRKDQKKDTGKGY